MFADFCLNVFKYLPLCQFRKLTFLPAPGRFRQSLVTCIFRSLKSAFQHILKVFPAIVCDGLSEGGKNMAAAGKFCLHCSIDMLLPCRTQEAACSKRQHFPLRFRQGWKVRFPDPCSGDNCMVVSDPFTVQHPANIRNRHLHA
ncbi:hypothetical protein IMSAGC019_03241 [Lachnospiraceae bacterium]|nr:hypothetical protein IMSAGC019_03241 [Lachnospiraceae bacterium]